MVSVHSGVHTNAAINSNGELFMWGKNKGACLGLGNLTGRKGGSIQDQYFPFRVSLINPVKQVKLGVDHTAAIVKALG